MPSKPLAGNALRATTRNICPGCGGRLRKPPRLTKRCPTCRQMRERKDWAHSSARTDHMDSQCRDCKRIREGREKRARATGQSTSGTRGERRRLTVLEPPFGSHNEIRDDVATGVVSSITRPSGWVEVEHSTTLVVKELPESQHNGCWVVGLRDCYYDDGEGPERSVYVGSDGRLFFYTADEWYRPGELVHVSFDADGVATQVAAPQLQEVEV